MEPLAIAVLLTLLMVCCVILEILTPSFGVLTMLALAFFIGSVIFGFKAGQVPGTVMLGLNTTLLPILVLVCMHYIRESPLSLKESLVAADLDDEVETAAHPWLGREARALTRLGPSGAVELDGERLDAVTAGQWVEPGQTVKVVRVQGHTLTVEPLDA